MRAVRYAAHGHILRRGAWRCFAGAPSDAAGGSPASAAALPAPSDTSSDFGSLDISAHRLQRPTKREPARQPPRTSLVAETLEGMEKDEEFQLTARQLKQLGQQTLTLEERKRRRRALDDLDIPPFSHFLQQHNVALQRVPSKVLQLNIGLYCNQACSHCHVESSPKRTEMMSRQVAEQCLHVVRASPSVDTVDITGGAPELCDQFRFLVSELRALERGWQAHGPGGRGPLTIMDRCNLTVLCEPGQEDLVDFLAEHRVHIVASLPCYSAKNVNMQRGRGVFGRSIDGLQLLNKAGYGTDPALQLDLVYNPIGAFLPPDQAALEQQYKAELAEHFGVRFNSLFAFTNMPIKRFADFLHRRGELADYMGLLARNFNPATVPGLMCTNTLSVDWSGAIHDCDFNQQLQMGLPMGAPGDAAGRASIFDVSDVRDLLGTDIAVDNHCFGCTAGRGSS